MSGRNKNIRDRIAQNDVTVARSYLEVNVMEWFSENQIPFAYEAFVIPSVVGPSQMVWDRMTGAIRALGNGNEQAYEESTRETPISDVSAFEALNMWNEIYDKHNLAGEQIVVPVQESLSEFDKTMVLPDFALYPDSEFKTAPPDFDYSSYDYIVEVSGLWGVGLPDESTESDWWDWYRVSAVAFKEYIYRLLGLWDDVFWVVPDQPFIEGISDGIPRELRDDPHYIITNTTSADLDLDELEDALGITSHSIRAGMSPPIESVRYTRIQNRSDLRSVEPRELPLGTQVEYEGILNDDGSFPTTDELPNEELPNSLTNLYGQIIPIEWTYDRLNFENVDNHENAVLISEDYLVFHGELGEVFVSDDSVHVSEEQWGGQNMILIREYVMDVLSQLDQVGIVEGLRRVD